MQQLASSKSVCDADLIKSLKLANIGQLKKLALLEHENEELRRQIQEKNDIIIRSKGKICQQQQVEREIQAQNLEIQQYIAQMAALQKEFERMKQKLHEGEEKIKELEAEKSTLQVSISRHKAVDDTVFNQIQLLKIENCEKQLEIDRLKALNDSMSKSQDDLSKHNKLELKIQNLRQKSAAK